MLIPPLSVAENIFLSMHDCGFVLNTQQMNEKILEFSDKFAIPVDPTAKIWQLSVGEQQRVEIMKLLCRNSEILVLDEPTAVLTHRRKPAKCSKRFARWPMRGNP